MSNEDSYSIKEMIQRVEEKLDSNTLETKETKKEVAGVKEQVSIANGRTRKLEDFSHETQAIIETLVKANNNHSEQTALINQKHDLDLKSVKTVAIVGISISTFFIGALVTLGFQNIKQSNIEYIKEQQSLLIDETAEKVVSLFETKFEIKIK